MPTIHPTAVIDRGAEIAAGADVGPYCTIGANAAIGEDCRLSAHVHVTGHTAIGARTRIAPFASLGTPPQSTRYRGGPTRLTIGADCDIREGVTMNVGTEDDRALTEVGQGCFLMVGSHVAHDCRVGANVTFANNVVLGGHVSVGDNVVFGGNTAVHQFVRVGEGAMVGGVSGVTADIIPFAFAFGQRAFLDGLNIVGLRRRGIAGAELHRLRRAYRQLFHGDGVFRDRLDAVEREFADEPLVAKVVAFIRAGGTRPLTLPERHRRADEPGGNAP